jgi:hypothetical protein
MENPKPTETKITLEVTFSGRRKLTGEEIWEFLDDKIQDTTHEVDDDDYHITVKKKK